MEENTGKTEIENLGTDEKLFNFRPVFFLAIFLCFGVIFGYFYTFKSVSFWWALVLVPIFLAPFLFAKTSKQRKRTALAMFSIVLSFFIGVLAIVSQVNDFRAQKTVQGETQIVGEVVEKEKGEYTISLLLEDISLNGESVKGKLVAYLPATFYEKVVLGDVIILQGKTENVGDNASIYEIENDVRYYAECEDFFLIGNDANLFFIIRERMCTVVENGLNDTNASVAIALLLGDTSMMDNGLLENVRAGGIAHVFAVSGLHVGALFAFCLLVFTRTKLKNLSKCERFIIVGVILILYGGVCGFSSSVIRAIIACLTAYGASLIGVGYDSLETLGLACIAVLLLCPISLFTVGFQLSFLACLGIILFARRIENFLFKLFHVQMDYTTRLPLGVGKRVMRSVIGVLGVSISAQITTAPILYGNFGYLSLLSLLLNFVFVPIIGVMFTLLLLIIMIACILPIGVSVILYPFEVVLSLLLLVFQVVDFSSFCLQGFIFPISGMICYYIALLFCTDKWNMRKRAGSLMIAVCMLFTVFLCVVATL